MVNKQVLQFITAVINSFFTVCPTLKALCLTKTRLVCMYVCMYVLLVIRGFMTASNRRLSLHRSFHSNLQTTRIVSVIPCVGLQQFWEAIWECTGAFSTTETVILLVTYVAVLARMNLACGVTCTPTGTFSGFEEIAWFCKEVGITKFVYREISEEEGKRRVRWERVRMTCCNLSFFFLLLFIYWLIDFFSFWFFKSMPVSFSLKNNKKTKK